MKTHNELILDHLKEHGSITQKEAINLFGLTCFTARISDLRKHHVIDDEYVEGVNRYGNKTKFKRYYYKGERTEVHN